jgi:hypothetical protein
MRCGLCSSVPSGTEEELRNLPNNQESIALRLRELVEPEKTLTLLLICLVR